MKLPGKQGKASEGTWVIGGGSELPCVNYIYGSKKHKAQVTKATEGSEFIVGRLQKICVHGKLPECS